MAQAQSQDEMESDINFVAQRVGTEWKWLGRELKVPFCVVENIGHEYTGNKEKAYQVMMKWYHSNGQTGATKEALIKALQAINLTSIADQLRISWSHESYQADPDMQSILQRLTRTLKSFAKAFDKQLDEILQRCRENIHDNPDPGSRVHNLRILRNIETMNATLVNDETATEEVRIGRKKRSEHIEDTIQLILQLLTDLHNKRPRTAKAVRPLSEIIISCTNTITIEKRSKTYSAGSSDSSGSSDPILVSRENVMSRHYRNEDGNRKSSPTSRTQETIWETINEVLTEEKEEITHCVKYYNEVETPDSSEAQEASLDENDNEILEPDVKEHATEHSERNITENTKL